MRSLVLAVALLVPLLGGCAMNRVATYPIGSPTEYTLDTGDVIRVTVYGDTTLTNTYTVTDKGTISVPLIGQVKARGQTVTAVEKTVTARLADGYIISPKVSIEVSAYRPFFIEGAVGKGGQYPYVWGMTARAAVATAEGFKDFAERSRVTIYRRTGKSMARFSAPLDAPIWPGDTIVVGERWL